MWSEMRHWKIFCFSQFSSPLEISGGANVRLVYSPLPQQHIEGVRAVKDYQTRFGFQNHIVTGII